MCFRFGVTGAAAANLVVSGFVAWATARGHGAFAHHTLARSLADSQAGGFWARRSAWACWPAAPSRS